MKLRPGATYQIKQKTKHTGEVSKRGKDVNYSHKFIFDGLSRNKRIAHFTHEKCGYRESFSAHALACGIISIKEMKKVSCPMTQKNVEKYNLTEKEEKSFCNKGCSVICKEEFEKYIQKRRKSND